ncbi:MAG: 4Fe-4S dicluster domain-containing protein [Candidatus Lokiarchaeota archaeon]|nr:4Fe-4S dicluster domain-containing protein [Candidatus Lokiarchaeota archaeon]MBD3201880.1 4Fe-4S dicluster domain-containing protein [Candidatus Lokiarchaeota archaeon]
MEKLFPISINTNLCVRCQKCSYSCPPKAIFWKDSMRYVDYNKCKGCLKCIEVCEHGAVEVISLEGKTLEGFEIDENRCNLCLNCTKDKFCFQNRFKFIESEKKINFDSQNLGDCLNCLKCFKDCPQNAILPKLS